MTGTRVFATLLLGLSCAGFPVDSPKQAGTPAERPVPAETDSGNAYRIEFPNDLGEPVVLDSRRGLMWEVKTWDGGMHDWSDARNWDGAVQFCEQLNGLNGGRGYAGFTDWRLPTAKELFDLVDFETFSPAVPSVFHNPEANSLCRPAMYWTGTVPAADQGRACYVDFFDGCVLIEIKYVKMYVRAVRNAGDSTSTEETGSIESGSPPSPDTR